MRIGVITLSRIKANQSIFYNLQDVGLAKALAEAGHDVVLYRLTEDADKYQQQDGVLMIFQKVNGIGKQAITNFSFLDGTLERLICFSDNQISFPALSNWCKTKKILLQPYIGVIYSNSPSLIVRKITNLLVWRNVKKYRKMKIYVKTPKMEQTLHKLKINDTEVVPVCLNASLLHQEVQEGEIQSIRKKYGYQPGEKVILFVGRMEPEKEPTEMVRIFAELNRNHPEYRLLMVGKGQLYEKVKVEIQNRRLESVIRMERQVLHQDMWQLYCMSSSFVNLNRHEIYGMAILEAMYYRCPVIAMHASGPDYIIKNDKTGFLCNTEKQLINQIKNVLEKRVVIEDTREYIELNFLWGRLTERFLK